MSEHHKNLEVIEEYKTMLRGEMQKNALDFADYMNEVSGWKYKGDDICFTVTCDKDPEKLLVFFDQLSRWTIS